MELVRKFSKKIELEKCVGGEMGFLEVPYSKSPKLNTVVSWTLTEKTGETKLVLEHSGFKRSSWLTKIMLTGGWKKMMNTDLYNKLVPTQMKSLVDNQNLTKQLKQK
jgi:hypothetical protein